MLHPGYGFLSESASFAETVESAGIAFVGPQPQTMKLLGNKEKAKELAVRCGVPILDALGSSVRSGALDTVLFAPMHSSQIANRVDSMIRLGHMEVEITRRMETLTEEFGGLDTDMLDQAGDFLDSVTGALDLIDGLGSVPDIGDPTPPVRGAMDQVRTASSGLQDAANLFDSLFQDEE